MNINDNDFITYRTRYDESIKKARCVNTFDDIIYLDNGDQCRVRDVISVIDRRQIVEKALNYLRNNINDYNSVSGDNITEEEVIYAQGQRIVDLPLNSLPSKVGIFLRKTTSQIFSEDD